MRSENDGFGSCLKSMCPNGYEIMAYAGFVRSCNELRAAQATYKDELLWRSSRGEPRKYQHISIFPVMTGVGIMTTLILV